MAEVYVGQVMMTGFAYAPRGFAQCNGQTLAIQQNQALFALLGTTYGGNGTSTFQLPNLQGRVPCGGGFASVDPAWQPSPYPLGTQAGTESVTLLPNQLPMHAHGFGASTTAGSAAAPLNGLFGKPVVAPSGTENIYVPATPGNLVPLANSTVGMLGGGGPHDNCQPSRVINFNIALNGYFPSRN